METTMRFFILLIGTIIAGLQPAFGFDFVESGVDLFETSVDLAEALFMLLQDRNDGVEFVLCGHVEILS